MKKTIISGLSLLSMSIFAQQEKDTVSIQEVVLTSTRMPEVKTNAAATVTIINSAQIQQMAEVTPDMSHILGQLAPGLALSSNTTSARTQTLRGRGLLVLIDGIPQSTPLRESSRDIRTIDPVAVERVEVIKGATSVYGNGAIGGIINIITKKNTTDRAIAGQSSISLTTNQGFTQEKGMGYRFSQQLYGKKKGFSYLLSGVLHQSGRAIDGEGQFISPRYGLGDTKTWNGLVKLGYEFNDNNKIEAMYNYYRSMQNTPLIASGGKYLVEPRVGIYGNRNPQAVDEGTPYNHNGYIKFTSKNIIENTNFELSAFTQNFYTVYDFRAHNPRQPRWEETSGQSAIKAQKYGVRAQMISKLKLSDNINTHLLYGGDFIIDKTSQPLVDGRYWVHPLTAYNYAPYLQTKTTLFKHLSVKLGARYDKIEVNVPNYNVLRLRLSDPIVSVKGGTLVYENISPNAGIAYDRYKIFQPFVAYSQGFSIFDLGRAALRDAKRPDVLNTISVEPVKTNNYETGFYTEIGKIAHINASYFYTYSKLGSDLIAQNGFWVVDRNPQKVSGFEIGGEVSPLKNINIGGSFTWFEGKKKLSNGNWEYMSNLSIPASKTTAYINARPIKNTFIQLQYLHTGSRKRFSPNISGVYKEGEGVVKSIDLFNLNAGYSIKDVSFHLGVENLFNKTYYTPASMLMARNDEYARGNGRYITFGITYKY